MSAADRPCGRSADQADPGQPGARGCDEGPCELRHRLRDGRPAGQGRAGRRRRRVARLPARVRCAHAGIDFRSLTVGGAGGAAATPTPAPAPATASSSSGSSSTSSSSSSALGSSSSSSSSGTRAAAVHRRRGHARAGASTLPPGVVAGTDGMNKLPFTFVFDGDYFSLNKLLDLIRSFTTTNGDTVTVRGRLMTVQSVNLQESRNGFPEVKATSPRPPTSRPRRSRCPADHDPHAVERHHAVHRRPPRPRRRPARRRPCPTPP